MVSEVTLAMEAGNMVCGLWLQGRRAVHVHAGIRMGNCRVKQMGRNGGPADAYTATRYSDEKPQQIKQIPVGRETEFMKLQPTVIATSVIPTTRSTTETQIASARTVEEWPYTPLHKWLALLRSNSNTVFIFSTVLS
jgi:hypothetical protein